MTSFTLIPGSIETRRPAAYCWYETTRTDLNPHMFPMEISALPGGNLNPAKLTLAALPAGRRCMRVSWAHGAVFIYAGDRAKNSDGTFATGSAQVASASPDTTGYYFHNEPDTNRVTITGATNANPCVITYTGTASFGNGDYVTIRSATNSSSQSSELNTEVPRLVANMNIGAKTFELPGVDSTSFVTYFANTGRVGIPSGYSHLYLDGFIAYWAPQMRQMGLDFLAAGVSVDFQAMDVESRIDEFKLGSVYRGLLVADPRWSTDTQPRLNAIINDATSGGTSTFSTSVWIAQNISDDGHVAATTTHNNAWDAYMWERQSLALDGGLIAPMQTVFPQSTGSNYEHHGRSGTVVNAESVGGGLTDLNANQYYQTRVTGSFSADYAYAWMDQQEIKVFNTYSRSAWLPSSCPYHGVIWELKRSMAALQSGRTLGVWLGWMGFDDSDLALGGYGKAGATDKCPYWEANAAIQALMSMVPVMVGGRWTTGLLTWNSRSYNLASGTGRLTLSNGGVDVANKLFWDNSNRIGRIRPGLMTSFAVEGSTGNDGTYTIDYSNGGIWYDAGTDRTYFRVNETPGSSTSDGFISMLCTDAHDALLEAVLADLDSHIGTVGPRSVLQRGIYIGESNTSDAEILPRGNPISWAGLRHGNQITYCIIIGRTKTDKTAWTSQAITGYVNGVSVGTVATISASKAYVYYTRTYSASETLTFTWSQTAETNLLSSTDPTDGSWTQTLGAGSITKNPAVLSPIDNSQAYHFNKAEAYHTFPVTEGKLYDVSMYALVDSTIAGASISVSRGSDGGGAVTLATNLTSSPHVRWERWYLNFVAEHGQTTYRLSIGAAANEKAFHACHIQAVQGILPAPPV